MYDVCVVGSANLDLVARTSRLPAPGETVLGSAYAEHPGGKGLNQAVAAARSGATVSFVGAVGDDRAGEVLRRVLADDDVTTDLVVVSNVAASGRAVITVDDDGENSIVIIAGANSQVAIDVLPECRVVLVQLEIPMDTVHDALVRARRAGAITMLNPAPAPPTPLPEGLLGLVDVLVPNEHEVRLLGGVDHLLSRGVRTVVTTRGGFGVDVATIGQRWHRPADVVDVVDTTGAGDAFCGALAARLAVGDELGVAVRYAVAAGALATTANGAVPSIPGGALIDQFVSDEPAGPPSRLG